MKITILGCGRWGTFLASYLDKLNHEILLWGRHGSGNLNRLIEKRANRNVVISENIKLTDSLFEAANFSDIIMLAIHGFSIKDFLQALKTVCTKHKILILCMKELDYESGLPLNEIVYNVFGDMIDSAICVGPVQPNDLLNSRDRSYMVIDSKNLELKRYLVELLNGGNINFIEGNDLIGNQIGAAAKNIIGIAGGILNALKAESLKSVLIVYGTAEIANLIDAMGGQYLSAYGLSCLGDYVSTVFSYNSRSLQYGMSLVNGDLMRDYVPGVKTVHAIIILMRRLKINMPIFETVDLIVSRTLKPHSIIDVLMGLIR